MLNVGNNIFVFVGNKKRIISIILFSFLFFEVLVLYTFSPAYYSYSICLYCFIHYIVSCAVFWKLKEKTNFFDFDVIFQTIYLFVMFVYPVFLYVDNPYKLPFFQFEFNENLITKCTILSLLGMQSYILGSVLTKPIGKKCLQSQKVLFNGWTVLLFIVVYIVFIIQGGLSTFSNLYSAKEASAGITYYLLIALSTLFLSSLSVSYLNFNLRNSLNPQSFPNFQYVDKFLFGITLVFCGSMFSVGSRTVPIQLCLATIGVYAFIHKISFLKMILLICVGALVMFGVMINRSGIDLGNLNFAFFDIFTDLIVNNRNTYVAMDYVNTEGMTLGKSMLLSVLSPIPFLQSIIVSVFDLNPMQLSSSVIITKISLSDNTLNVGFGTNIIADLYMAFGLLGVVVGMFLLGKFVAYLMARSMSSIYHCTFYIVMISYSIYIVRAEYFVFLRLLLWTACMINIIKYHPINLVWKKRKF